MALKPKPICIPNPFHQLRAAGWAKTGDKALLISIESGVIKIHTCSICSTEDSHHNVNNISHVVIWGDSPFNPLADNADDAHEKTVMVKNPHLVLLSEVEHLFDPDSCIVWFTAIYDHNTARNISNALKEKLPVSSAFHAAVKKPTVK